MSVYLGCSDGRVWARAFIKRALGVIRPDGTKVVSEVGSYGAYRDAVTGECEQTLEGHSSVVSRRHSARMARKSYPAAAIRRCAQDAVTGSVSKRRGIRMA